ncbi:hypothetical protein [Intestinibacter sp.]|uniref:hypothetical protein n=1 Tax=Intestinibacter sp. TaxID=1965304 RepID=UPI003F14154C
MNAAGSNIKQTIIVTPVGDNSSTLEASTFRGKPSVDLSRFNYSAGSNSYINFYNAT